MRAEGDHIKINYWLLPLSWLYSLGVRLRNQLFKMGILKEQTFDIPVISVGNITVGGTGKTPHVEYLIRLLLKEHIKVAVLSRGYKRKTKSYVLANENSTMREIGDEPFQMKSKFPDIYMAVDNNRKHGITTLTTEEKTKDVGAVLLDDAFQHRYVKPGINIMLVDYHRFIMNDELLPAGRLREPVSGKERADVVIVTKCPHDLKPMEYRVLTKNLNLYPFQSLYFTELQYDSLTPLYGGKECSLHSLRRTNILLLTGIASPKQMKEDLTKYCKHITSLSYDDHHEFSSLDIMHINEAFRLMKSPKIIITTEKDAARLIHTKELSKESKNSLYVLPVRIKFLLDGEGGFNQKIINYVRKDSRNSILVKSKDDNKSKNSNYIGNRIRSISFRDNR